MNTEKRSTYWKGIGFFIALLLLGGAVTLYLNPVSLFTESAKQLQSGTVDRVNAENAVRTNILHSTGALFAIATLAISVWNARTARAALEHDRKKQWRAQVRDAYAEWAALFGRVNSIGCDLAEARLARARGKQDVLVSQEGNLLGRFHEDHAQMQMIAHRISMLEERDPVRRAFRELCSQRFPNDPCAIKGEEEMRRFWETTEKSPKIVGAFLDLSHKRLTAFADWFKRAERAEDASAKGPEEFMLPCGHEFLETVNKEFGEKTFEPRHASTCPKHPSAPSTHESERA